MDFAFAYIMGNQGIHTDDDYGPYLMEEGYCKGKQVGTWNKCFRENSDIQSCNYNNSVT